MSKKYDGEHVVGDNHIVLAGNWVVVDGLTYCADEDTTAGNIRQLIADAEQKNPENVIITTCSFERNLSEIDGWIAEGDLTKEDKQDFIKDYETQNEGFFTFGKQLWKSASRLKPASA